MLDGGGENDCEHSGGSDGCTGIDDGGSNDGSDYRFKAFDTLSSFLFSFVCANENISGTNFDIHLKHLFCCCFFCWEWVFWFHMKTL